MPDGKNYLSDVIICSSFKLGMLNLIQADCGAGKTTAAFETIPNYLGINTAKALILINTVSGAEALVKDGRGHYFEIYGPEWDVELGEQLATLNKPTIMTYALFGAQLKKGTLHLEDYDYIVCDEIHTLNRYIGIARGKLRKAYPQAAPWEINDMVQMTCFSYMAIEAIAHAIQSARTWVFALTATPEQLYKNDLQILGAMVNEVQYSQKIHAFEIFQKFEYGEIEPILRALVPENRKRLFYFNTINELKQYKQILLECGRKAEALWSVTNSERMDAHQLTTREIVLTEHRFPNDVQDLLINSAYETSINIKDPLVQEAYLHTSNKEMQVQARGRLRQNLDKVGVYNKDKKKYNRKITGSLKAADIQSNSIPNEFLNTPLYAEQKNQLIEILKFPKKWPSLKKHLIEQGMLVSDHTDGKHRYSLISLSDN